jgi:hypothetical protein
MDFPTSNITQRNNADRIALNLMREAKRSIRKPGLIRGTPGMRKAFVVKEIRQIRRRAVT